MVKKKTTNKTGIPRKPVISHIKSVLKIRRASKKVTQIMASVVVQIYSIATETVTLTSTESDGYGKLSYSMKALDEYYFNEL